MTNWGPLVTVGSGTSVQLGLDVQGTPHGQPVRAVVHLWVESGWFETGQGSFSVSGSHAGSGSISGRYTRGDYVLGFFDINATRKYGAAVRGAVSATATILGRAVSVGAVSWTVPALPWQKADPVKNLVAVYRSDSRIDLTFTPQYTGTNGAKPITGHLIERADFQGGWKWSEVARVAANTKTWNDTNVTSNNVYRYRITSLGRGGNSNIAATNYVRTTPAGVEDLVAAKQANGADILVSFTGQAAEMSDLTVHEIWEGVTKLGTVPWDEGKFLVTGASTTVEHRFSVVTVTDGLKSPPVLSNTVLLAAPPLAPVNLTPNGTWVAQAQDAVLRWDHVPADTTPQTRFRWRYRIGDAPEWTTSEIIVSAESKVVLPGSLLGSATTVEWQVQTWGSDASKEGAWSASARFYLEPQPTVTVSKPVSPVKGDNATVEFTPGVPGMYTWDLELYVGDVSGTPIFETSGSGSTASFTARVTRLVNGQAYTARVRIRSHVASEWVARKFVVEYPAPPTPVVQLDWDPADGTMTVNTTNPSGNPAAVRNSVEKTIGSVRQVLAMDVPVNSSVVDRTPNGRGINRYTVIAESALGITSWTTVELDTRPKPLQSIVVSSPDGVISVRVAWNPEHSRKIELVNSERRWFAGRKKPVLFTGQQTERTVEVAGAILPEEAEQEDSFLEKYDRLATYGKPVLYRDPSGMRMWSEVSGVELEYDRTTGVWEVSFTCSEVDHDGD